MRGVAPLVALALVTLALPQPGRAGHALTALDPVEVYSDGFGDLRGIAVDPAGNVFVSDRAAGRVTRIAPDRTKTILVSGLERPIGLAFDLSGRLLIAEEREARVVRLEPGGALTPLVTGIKQPRWLAVREDGTLYIAARRLTRGTDPEPDDESAEPEVILALSPAGQLSVFADGFRHLQGLVVTADTLFAATRGRQGEPQADGAVYRIPILADGSAGPLTTPWPRDAFKKPVGLARDRLGALWLTTKELDLQEDESKRAVAKLHPGGAVTLFAENLARPQGLGFDASGNLYVADGSSGRVLRFLAPGAPVVTSPLFTAQSPLALTGTTAPGARVDVFVDDTPTPITVTADATGAFHRYERIAGLANQAGLAAITDRAGNTVTITRTSNIPAGLFGLITRLTEPAGRQINLTYDAAGRITAVTDPLGRTVQYTYDAQGRLETVTDPAAGVTRYAYDAQHRIVAITDPRGITYLTNEYDAQGRVVRQIQADGGVFTFAYVTAGDTITETTVTDPRGHATTHRFSSAGFPLSTTDAFGQTTVFEYAMGTNLLLATTDPLGRTTRFAYDAQGNVTSLTDPAGNVRSFTYEPTFNQLASITDPLGQVTQFGYDAQGNLSAITDPIDKVTTLTYNAAGQPVTTTDPLGNTTTFSYDGQGNLASAADPLGNTTARTYDTVSRIIGQTDPRGRATAFAYDPLNRLTAITDALGGVTGFNYDPNGNALTVTDARGNAITHTYDVMDRLAARTDPLGASETFVYDLAGNLTQRIDRKGQVSTFSYDALNRLATSSYADGSATSFAYDAVGRLVREDDSIGSTLTNSYDMLDRLVAQSTTLGTVSYHYDALGRRIRLGVPGILPTTYSYDANSRLIQILQGLQTVGFEYDDAGRRTLLTLPNGVSTEYQYDIASRLTALIYRNAAGLLGDLTYQYDSAGNRGRIGGSLARTLLPSPTASATYDAANRQLAFGNQAMTFDANGNLTTLVEPGGTTTFTWDARDRLIGVEQPGTLATFAYAFGRRLSKTVNGAMTQFLYDGLDIAQQVTPEGTTSHLRSLALDELLGLINLNGTFFSIADRLGSTLAITDASGNAVTEYTYDPFGVTTATNPGFPNPFQFTGRENDGLAGLYYYRARYYHPGLQRFFSEDPVGFEGGDVNLYAYVFNNPIEFTDPSGTVYQLPPECRRDREADALPEMAGRKDGIWSKVARFAKKLAYIVVRKLDCDPTLDLMPGGLGMAKGPLKAKKLFKSADALRRSNKQVRDIVKEFGLTREQQQQLHRAISGENMTYQEIRDLAKSLFDK